MASAIQSSGFAALTQECIDNLFIVAEPEAAAEFVLSSFLEHQKIRAGETFVMLDAGGGTVDATTYKLTRSDPVRLERQAVKHGADVCGSSILNDGYKKRIEDRLQGEILPLQGSELRHYIDGLVTRWENGEKRRIDVTDRRRDPNDLYIPGLSANPDKGFRANNMRWSRDEMKGIFDPVLKDVLGVLGGQLKAAKEEQYSLNASKVVLIGGFSESPSLVKVLQGYLARPQNYNLTGFEIDLLVPENFRTSAVARGAVLRALRKEHGPERRSRSSFGFKRHELHDPAKPQHKGVSVKTDLVDEFDTIDNTIFWVIQKDQLLENRYQHETIECWHTFPPDAEELLCREELYVADEPKEPHYRLRHKKNRGAKLLTHVEIDMTYLLRANPPLQLETPNVPEGAANANMLHYRIVFGMVMIVEGRNMRFEVRYPKDSEEVCRSAHISMAPAFAPGTA